MITTNKSHLPVAVVVLSGEMNLEDVETLRRFYTAVHERGQRFATIVDARRVRGTPSSPVRRALGELTNDFQDRSKRNLVGVATVLNSKILIGALTAIRWFIREEVGELRYFDTAAAALVWIDAKLGAERQALPAPSRGFIERLDGDDDVATFGD